MTALASDPAVRRRGLRRAEFDVLVASGVFEGARVELLGGELVEMSPQGVRHRWVAAQMHRALLIALGEQYQVASHSPIALDDESEPEPDVAVTDLLGPDELPSGVHLDVEIADSSLRLDLVHKAPRYAAGGVRELWVVDLNSGEVVVHQDPTPDGYGNVRRVPGDAVLTVLGVTIDLSTVLP